MAAGRGNAAFVAFEHVQKSYDGETLVVKDLNLDIGRGEFLTMLGPSGSGKTTCLMMLAGFETATHGEIRLGGRPINNIAAAQARHRHGVPELRAVPAHDGGREPRLSAAGAQAVRRPRSRPRSRRALDMVQMGAFAGRRPAQLSGGQQQRIALARALVFEPELVLMDEPLGALDKQLREHMQFEIKHLHERLGVTVVYVTHDQGEALTMSDRIAVFNDGRIQQLAPPEDLYERPENRFVASFIGENNTLEGTVETIDGRHLHRAAADGRAARRGAGQRQPRRASAPPSRSAPSGSSSSRRSIPPGAHTLEAEVLEFIYMGDIFRTRMRVAGNDNFVMKCRNSVDQRQARPRRAGADRLAAAGLPGARRRLTLTGRRSATGPGTTATTNRRLTE